MPRHGDLLADAEFRPFLPDARLVDRGVIFTDLATAAREHPDLVRRHLGTGTPPASHAGLLGTVAGRLDERDVPLRAAAGRG